MQITNETRSIKPEYLEQAKAGLEKLLSRGEIGFFRSAERDDLWKQSQLRGNELSQKYESLVIVGIGGSSLGVRALYQALGSDKKVFFIDNVDGQEFVSLMSQLGDLGKVHWLLVSKSGGTLETLTVADFVSQILGENGLELKDHATVVTEEKKSLLYDWAEKNSVTTLPIPLDVGGRFSVLTPVGLLPSAFMGHSLEEMQKGAASALKSRELVEALVAQTLVSWQNEEWLTPFWFYSSKMFESGRWVQQLWAESLAKKVDRAGQSAQRASVPLPLLGSTDQHSVLQQLSEGIEKKFIWFFRIAEAEEMGPVLSGGAFTEKTMMQDRPMGYLLAAFAQSTQKALQNDGVHSVTLQMDRLSAHEMGHFFMTQMLVVGTLGECLGINAFDQPGVEQGKKLVTAVLQNKLSE